MLMLMYLHQEGFLWVRKPGLSFKHRYVILLPDKLEFYKETLLKKRCGWLRIKPGLTIVKWCVPNLSQISQMQFPIFSRTAIRSSAASEGDASSCGSYMLQFAVQPEGKGLGHVFAATTQVCVAYRS
jgi:hypothetical protein